MARILIIEDSPESLELMVYLLEAYGHTALAAPTGQRGLAILDSTPVDIVVCDVELPVTSGIEVVKQVRATPKLSRLPVVAVTAVAQLGDEQRILHSGFNGYISKPIDPTVFVQQLLAFMPRGD